MAGPLAASIIGRTGGVRSAGGDCWGNHADGRSYYDIPVLGSDEAIAGLVGKLTRKGGNNGNYFGVSTHTRKTADQVEREQMTSSSAVEEQREQAEIAHLERAVAIRRLRDQLAGLSVAPGEKELDSAAIQQQVLEDGGTF
jgi:hypothetical protein